MHPNNETFMLRERWETKSPEWLAANLRPVMPATRKWFKGWFREHLHGDLPQAESALDFGCGVGRLCEMLREASKLVDGYDLPKIIEFTKSKQTYDRLFSDWSEVSGRKYDFIFAAQVFQHMDSEELSGRLRDMKQMTDRLYVTSRWDMDESPCVKEVLHIVTEQGWRPLSLVGNLEGIPGAHWQGVFEPMPETP